MTVLIGILFFCVIVIIHELGHFGAAKLFKMRVYEFSLGMGPVLLKTRKNGTQYSLKLLPIGGSVQLGEDEDSDDVNSFRNRPVWQRMIVMVAGAFMNLLLGFIICIFISISLNLIPTNIIHSFRPDAVSNSVLQAGDEILAINGSGVLTSFELEYQFANTEVKLKDGEDTAYFDILVLRNGEKVLINDVTFNAVSNGNGGMIIYNDIIRLGLDKSFGTVISYSFKNTLSLGRLVLMSLRDLLRGTYGINDFSGPVGLVSEIHKVASIGISQLLVMFALITVNVGIFNLLPIPALDGARILFFIIEAIRRKPIKAELEGFIHFVGFAAMMLLVVVVTFNDIRRLFGG